MSKLSKPIFKVFKLTVFFYFNLLSIVQINAQSFKGKPLSNLNLGEISYYDINQELLDALRSRYRLQKTPYYLAKMSIGNFSASGVVRQQVYINCGSQRVKDKLFAKKKRLTKGKLIAADTNGIYLYQKSAKKLGFVPYSDIWYIRTGNTLSDKIIRDVVLGAGLSGVIGLSYGLYWEDIFYSIYLGTLGASTGALFSSFLAIPEWIIHELQNASEDRKFEIYYRRENQAAYLNMLENDRNRYGKRIFYSEFPESTNPKINQDPAISAHPSNKLKPSGNTLNIINKPHLGIGLILDSMTSISRSYAVYELFQKKPMVVNNDTLFPVIVDYHFNSTFAIRGYCSPSSFKLKISKNGSKFKEIETKNNWDSVYNGIYRCLNEGVDVLPKMKRITIKESKMANVESPGNDFVKHSIAGCFPGYLKINVPQHSIIDTFGRSDWGFIPASNRKKKVANISYYETNNTYVTLKELYGKYHISDENALFFFRNWDVPYKLRETVKPLVFPLSSSLMPCLSYLSLAKILQEDRDFLASSNALQSCLMTSNKIIASSKEKALIRSIAFAELGEVNLKISDSRSHVKELFQLGSELNRAYVISLKADTLQKKYYKNIDEIREFSVDAEKQAKIIRDEKIAGMVGAVGTLATMTAVVASGAPLVDNASSIIQSMSNQTIANFKNDLQAANEVSNALEKQFENIDEMVNANSFITDEDTKVDLDKTFIAGEVGYYLSTSPELVKNALYEYAIDKKKLKYLLDDFYKKGEPQLNHIKELMMHFSYIEKTILSFEIRGKVLPKEVYSKF